MLSRTKEKTLPLQSRSSLKQITIRVKYKGGVRLKNILVEKKNSFKIINYFDLMLKKFLIKNKIIFCHKICLKSENLLEVGTLNIKEMLVTFFIFWQLICAF